ncbi:MAG TPA: ornithine carbamoyltransferase [Bdellovibrionales bacterium]|nr:MAG: ornithine carbamoyltransferase [Bdellovibrionales bacterium GWB1_52_6]OFZ04273.1 MAG: ornithine carbamoyltransferase [Bdellovibrionales bacterium GWA1_52_35]OFZ43526.1 MAG: ornithine carbamoyltransferase [Bdellovibrionales bacterium GWC1_52_8]HAR43963.1 ornithine carbamoyltransferase [Bdellovibrionales bacterium]HCM40880.1 ornithine carbamoyltransferase [Bdellovibrionales bacterium]
MPTNLKGRSFLTLKDYSPFEIRYLLDLSRDLKNLKRAGVYPKRLANKNIALIFEKASTRTRCAFTVACHDEGAHPEFLGKNDIQMGKKESIPDTARVLGRMFDGIEFRGFDQRVVEELAKWSGVPVWNGLTDEDHPTQVLADFLTIEENLGNIKGKKLVYIGDGRNNVSNALLIGAMKMGMHYTVAAPEVLLPTRELRDWAAKVAKETGAVLELETDPHKAVKNAHAIYTDVWVSMGEEDKPGIKERIESLRPYQVNSALMASTGRSDTIFLHCLPAHHTNGVHDMEVTEDVIESPASKVFDEAENRLHTIKAVMIATLT